jgi:hypothetical protein
MKASVVLSGCVFSIVVLVVAARYGAVLARWGGLAGAFVVPHGCMGIERSGGAKWMLCLSAASSS